MVWNLQESKWKKITTEHLRIAAFATNHFQNVETADSAQILLAMRMVLRVTDFLVNHISRQAKFS